MQNNKKVGFISLGCPKNLVDTEVMMGSLGELGYGLVSDPADADIIIINTCGFIEDAKKESIDAIIEMGTLAGSQKKHLVVTGCLTQRYKERMRSLFPEVDLFVGTGEYQKIGLLLDALYKGKTKRGEVVAGVPVYVHGARTPRRIATPSHSVYVKIAEGCSHGCSFCIIPKLRGKYRSRRVSDIAAEVRRLIDGGAREINLIAQDTTAYGRDLKDGTDLVKLVRRLSALDKNIWIRIMYAHPVNFTDELIDTIRDRANVCKYVDIPIQHISDRILKLMRRKESGGEIRNLFAKLRERIPGVVIRTSLIVGYPSETAKEFQELKNFVEDFKFDRLGVFAYSKEDGTHAAKQPKQVAARIKEARKNEIMEVQREISLAKNLSLVGSTITALFEGVSEESDLLWAARSAGQAPEIDGIIYINDISKGRYKPGDLVNVEITEAHEYDLIGMIIGKA